MFRPVVPVRAARFALHSFLAFAWMLPASPVRASPPLIARPAVVSMPAARAVEDVGAWIPLTPPALEAHASIYDPARDRAYVFGGNSVGVFAYVNDTWMFVPADMAWHRVAVDASVVQPRAWASAIHDPVGDRMIVFGGDLGGGYYPAGDVCALSLAAPPAWTALAPSGAPGARMMHAATYDAARRRMIVFGGTDGYYLLDDAWALSLGDAPAWSPLYPAGSPPAGRYLASATYDPVRDRVIVVGGVTAGGVIVNEVWALDLADGGAWTPLAPAGPQPSARMGHAAVYDPSGDRLVVYGGVSETEYLDDAWALSLGVSPAWTPLAPSGEAPPRQAFHAAAYDARRDRLVSFGGHAETGVATCETWMLSLGASPAWTCARSPGAVLDASFTADPARDRAILVGGSVRSEATDAVWSLALSGPPAWTRLAPSGPGPAPRANHAAVNDATRDRLVVFGGDDAGWSYFGDAWALSLSGSPAWTSLAPSGTPPTARSRHTAILDPVRERMIVYGGQSAAGARFDVWALSLAGAPAWTNLAPSGTPPAARWNHVAIYDPVGDRMIVHGGENPGQVFEDTWALSLAGAPAWSQLAPVGEIPYARSGHAAVFDPLASRMIVTGGTYGAACEVFALTLTGPPEWTPLAPDGPAMPGRVGHEAAYDTDRDRLVVFGGSPAAGDLWALARSFGSVGVPSAPPATTLHASWAPNPARGGAALALGLDEGARVTLRLFDVGGRQVRTMDLGSRAAGTHRVGWDGRDDAGRVLPPGLYFGEVRADGRVAHARLVIAR